jgi:hypothetical protein
MLSQQHACDNVASYSGGINAHMLPTRCRRYKSGNGSAAQRAVSTNLLPEEHALEAER